MDLTGSLIDQRYRLDAIIASSNFSTVYRATRLHDDLPVTVKVLSGAARRLENRFRFRTEISAIAQIDHPHIVKIIEIGNLEESQQPSHNYLVMEYLAGRSLDRFNLDGFDLTAGLQLMIQLGEALVVIHGAGFMHGDLKPPHLIITDEKDLTLKVVDFGLARIVRQASPATDGNITGTYAYMAPEQLGLIQRPIDARSDLYALGVIFYQLLCDRLPFIGQNLAQLLHAQIAQVPAPPSTHHPEVPPVIDQIVLRLLAKEPDQRYQQAASLLGDLRKAAAGQVDFQIGIGDRLGAPNFITRTIGRDALLGRLTRELKHTQNGNGCCCFVSGSAGMGKTRIVGEMHQRIMAGTTVVAEGRCIARTSKTPWGLFAEVLSNYLKIYQTYPPDKKAHLAAQLQQQCGDFGQIVIACNPAARRLLGECPPVTRLDPEKETLRSCIVISCFFYALATAEGSLALLLEDLQWSDGASLMLLGELARHIAGERLFILATFRDDEIPSDHPLNDLVRSEPADEAMVHHRVSALDQRMLREYVTEALGQTDAGIEPLVAFLDSRCLGNPLFIQQMLRHLISAGILDHRDGRWSLDHQRLDQAALPQSLVEILTNRIELLDPQDHRILSMAAVAGRVIDADLLVPLVDGDVDAVGGALQRGLDQQLLEETPGGPANVRFIHDRIQEAFYTHLDAGLKQQYHDTIAGLLENQLGAGSAQVYAVAHHFMQAGNSAKILQYALPAAQQANRVYAYQDAIAYLTTAEGLLSETHQQQATDETREKWLACAELLADTLINAGQFEAASKRLEVMLKQRRSPANQAALLLNLTRAANHLSQFEVAEDYARKGLGLLGERLPVSRPGIIWGSLRELLRHGIYCLLRRGFKPCQEGSKARRYQLIAEYYWHLFWTYHTNAVWKVPRIILRWLNISERHLGKSRPLALSLMHYSFLCAMAYRFSRALRYAGYAHAISTEMQDDWLLADCARAYHVLYSITGRFAESLKWAHKAHAFFSQTGEFHELLTVIMGLAINHCELGEIAQGVAVIENSRQHARDQKEAAWMANAVLSGSCYADLGDFKRAEKAILEYQEVLNQPGSEFGLCINAIDYGRYHVLKGDLAAGIKCFEAALALMRENSFLPNFVNAVHNLYPDALLRELATRRKQLSQSEVRQTLKRIRRLCRKALRNNRRHVWWYGQALKVMGDYWFAAGNPKQAQGYYEKAFDHFNAFGQRYKLARAQFDYGQHLLDWDQEVPAWTYLENAHQLFEELGLTYWRNQTAAFLGLPAAVEERPTGLRDQQQAATILSFGKELAQLHDVDAIVDKVIAKAMELTGAEAGGLFLSEADFEAVALKAYQQLGEGDGFKYSQHVVEQVFRTGQAVLTADAADEEAFRHYLSVERQRLKSILCVPLRYNELINGVCYLHNPLAGGVFTDPEKQILEAFLPYAAIALENALFNRLATTTPTAPPSDKNQAATSDPRLIDILAYIEDHFAEALSRELLAELSGVTPDYLGKLFKAQTGQSLRAHINGLRIAKATDLLSQSSMKIIDIAFEVGFESLRTFNRLFYRTMGDTPSSYRDHHYR